MTKNPRVSLYLLCTGHDSAQRSPLTPFESGYVEFRDKGGTYYRYFNEKEGGSFRTGMVYHISAILTPKRTLQRVKVIPIIDCYKEPSFFSGCI